MPKNSAKERPIMAQNAESKALAEELEQEEETSILENKSDFQNFPTDEYVPAVILSYQTANVPVDKKYLKKGQKDKRHSVRFMFAAHLRDEKGNPVYREDEDENGNKVMTPVILRKWTKWLTISYGENAGLVKLFCGVSDLEGLLKADGLRLVNGQRKGRADRMWTTQFQIFVEKAKADSKYTNITKVKIDDKLTTNELDIDYSVDYVPYRTAPAFGNDVYLELAVCKLPDHIHRYNPDEMVDAPAKDDKKK